MSSIKDINLAPSGAHKIDWVRKNCPLLRSLEDDFSKEKPFEGIRIALSIHLEAKTAYLCKVLAAGGAEMYITGSNPLSTQDDVAAALVADGLNVFAWYNCTPEEYDQHITSVLENNCNIIIDDGGDLVHMLHTKMQDKLQYVIGGCEETTTGIIRLIAMAKNNELKFPMVLVNNADCKHLFDNRYGTGQSVFDGINRTTNLIVAGKYVVVAGYGWCGKGVAMRAKGLGAKVIVTEVDPIKAIEAVMDGFDVMPMNEAAKIGDFFITVTGVPFATPMNFMPASTHALMVSVPAYSSPRTMSSLPMHSSFVISSVTFPFPCFNSPQIVISQYSLIASSSFSGIGVHKAIFFFAISIFLPKIFTYLNNKQIFAIRLHYLLILPDQLRLMLS